MDRRGLMRRPKWITVVAALALIAALAIASPGVAVSIKKLVKKEVSKQIKKATGPAGTPGAPGAAGTTKAGARVVGSDASLSPGTAFGGIEATKSAAGGYCIRVPFTPRNIQVSPESDDHNARVRLVAFGGGFGTCSGTLPGHQAWVTTHTIVGNTLSDSDFHILVD
jgi:hypothetical protein